MKETITLPVTNYNRLFSNIFLSKIFSNLLYHFKSREKAEDIFKKLLNIYHINRDMLEKAEFSNFKINSNIKSLDACNGLIIATSHFGVYPFIPFLMAEYFNKSVAVIVLGNAEFYVKEIKSHYDMKNKDFDIYPLELTNKASIIKIIKAVKVGHFVLVYADANYSQPNVKEENNDVYCNFLDHKIKARPGFCKLSYLTGMPTVYAFMENREGTFHLNISDSINIQKKDKEENFQSVIQSFYSELERYINNAPEYWFMWNIFNDLIIRNNNNRSNDYILNCETMEMKFDINKFFCFEWKDNIYIHLVDKFSNIKISIVLLGAIENLFDKSFTMMELENYLINIDESLIQSIKKDISFLFKERIIFKVK